MITHDLAPEPGGAELRAEPVSEALKPPPGNPRFPALDGIRGLAALAIVVFHAGIASDYNRLGRYGLLTTHLDVGVAVFFVLSGFLLYRPFVRAHRDGDRPPETMRFYRRRIIRIVPAYWTALVLLTVLPGMVQINSDLSALHTSKWAVYYLFLQNFSVRTAVGGLGQAWSLAVEMSFYLALPLLAAIAIAVRRPRADVALIASLGLASVVARTVSYGLGESRPLAITILETFAWLAGGMLLAIISVDAERTSRPRSIPLAPCWAAALGVFIVCAVTLPRRDIPGSLNGLTAMAEYVEYLAVAVLVVAPLVVGPVRGRLARLTASRPLQLLGTVSYGVFLWHIMPVLYAGSHIGAATDPRLRMVVVSLAGITGGIVLGTASYVLVERVALRLKG